MTDTRRAIRRRQFGFTLLEMLVVVVIAGITLGIVSLNAMPSDRQALEREAQRVATLMQLARDEAIVRNQPVAFEVNPEGYRFLFRENNAWLPLASDDLLRARSFDRVPMVLTINPAQVQENGQMRIVFGREPVDRPFILTMASGETAVSIRADGVSHFFVE